MRAVSCRMMGKRREKLTITLSATMSTGRWGLVSPAVECVKLTGVWLQGPREGGVRSI